MSSTLKRYLFLGIFFSVFALAFVLLHHFNIIRDMDLLLAVTYVSYFVGIALIYNGAYLREHSKTKSTGLCFIIGSLFVVLSTTLLIYGIATGRILLFNINF